jgi:hypothetical protein
VIVQYLGLLLLPAATSRPALLPNSPHPLGPYPPLHSHLPRTVSLGAVEQPVLLALEIAASACVITLSLRAYVAASELKLLQGDSPSRYSCCCCTGLYRVGLHGIQLSWTVRCSPPPHAHTQPTLPHSVAYWREAVSRFLELFVEGTSITLAPFAPPRFLERLFQILTRLVRLLFAFGRTDDLGHDIVLEHIGLLDVYAQVCQFTQSVSVMTPCYPSYVLPVRILVTEALSSVRPLQPRHL